MNLTPEYVKHVKHTHAVMDRAAWCGAKLLRSEFVFQNIDHAVYERLNGGRLLICPHCVTAIVAALKE